MLAQALCDDTLHERHFVVAWRLIFIRLTAPAFWGLVVSCMGGLMEGFTLRTGTATE